MSIARVLGSRDRDRDPVRRREVGEVLVLHTGRRPAPETVAQAERLPADPAHTVVLVDVERPSWPRLGPALGGDLGGAASGLRFVPCDGEPLDALGSEAAAALRRPVLVADGPLRPTADGGRLVAGPSGRWVRFVPDRAAEPLGRRFPARFWESAVTDTPHRLDDGLVVEPLPAGVWIHHDRGDEDERAQRVTLRERVVALDDTLTCVLGAPGTPEIPVDAVARVVRRFPPEHRALVRVAASGPVEHGAGFGDRLAAVLGEPVSAWTELPLAGRDGADVRVHDPSPAPVVVEPASADGASGAEPVGASAAVPSRPEPVGASAAVPSRPEPVGAATAVPSPPEAVVVGVPDLSPVGLPTIAPVAPPVATAATPTHAVAGTPRSAEVPAEAPIPALVPTVTPVPPAATGPAATGTAEQHAGTSRRTDGEPPAAAAPVVAAPTRFLPRRVPVAAASIEVAGRDLTKERAWMRTALGARYDTAAAVVARVLSENPGLRGGLRASDPDLLADLVALRVHLGDDESTRRGLAVAVGRGRPGPHTPFARGVAAGLSRMPAYRGAVGVVVDRTHRQGADPDTVLDAYAAHEDVVEHGLVLAGPAGAAVPDVDEVAVLAVTTSTRRTRALDPERPDRLGALPGTRYRVLAVDRAARTVWLREAFARETAEVAHRLDGSARAALEDVAPTGGAGPVRGGAPGLVPGEGAA